MRIELTGRLRVVNGGGSVVDERAFPGRQARSVFAYLAAHHRPVSRDELAELLWPDRLPASWERDLSVVVSRLRALLRSHGFDAGAMLISSARVYELRLPAGAVVDVDTVPAGLERGEAAFRAGDWEGALAAASMCTESARQPLLPDIDAPWLDTRRDDLRALLVQGLGLAARARARLGETAEAVRCAREAVALDPLAERQYVVLMRVLLDVGERAEAVRVYELCRRRLAEELGVAPSPETERVYLDALGREAGAGHGDSARPGDGTIAPTHASPAGNLPAPVDSFVGRDTDLVGLARLVARCRIVTLVGAGGVGKSRLAAECARRLAPDYRDGAWLCELAPLRSGGAAAHAVAAAVAIGPVPSADPLADLVAALRGRHLLLVLDNCEHLLDQVRSLVRALTDGCPSIDVVATSRQPLDTLGEHVWHVQPLALPFPGAQPNSPLYATPALELFAERARAADPGFALTGDTAAAVADICRRVDGLPLAIELAARWVSVLSPREIADRLQDPLRLLVGRRSADAGRHRDLRRTIDWSYTMLEEPQQRAFECMAAFAGDFDLAAAEAVCAPEGHDMLELLGGLVDCSMVLARPGSPTRYRLFETLRQYARERLDARGEVAHAAARHARHFVSVAEDAEPLLRSAHETDATALLDRELANLRVAHTWARAHALELALRLSAALHWHAFFRHRFELYEWAEWAVQTPGAAGLPGFAAAASSAANGAWVRGDRTLAAQLGRQALQSAAPDDPERRFPAHVLGDVAFFEGRLDAAFSWYGDALASARAAGDAYHAALMLGNHALIRGYQGDLDGALRLAEAAEAEARPTGSPTCVAWAHYAAGEAFSVGDPDRAIEALEKSMAAARRARNQFVLGVALVTVTSLRGRYGELGYALRSFLDVIDHWHAAANWTQQWTALRSLVVLLLRMGRHEDAAVLLAAIRRASTAAPAFGADAERLRDAEEAVASALGPDMATTAAARGHRLTDDETLRFARAAICDALTTV
ncbi:MAG: AfsR/SARP family transcriptional regulator [Acidimicrobiales bacterium]